MRYISKTKLLFLVSVLTLIFTFCITYAKSTANDISKSVLRLHILANSNSAADQALKFKIRDRILTDCGYLFKDIQCLEDAISTANTHNHTLKQIAENEINSNGFDYPVKVSVESCAFPTKSYESITLPSGKYTALRIEIGEAKGENWWCVMYPPLCLTDGVLAASDNAKNKLKANLKPSEYDLITKQDSGAIPVEIRFKIVEIFQNLFN